MARPSSYNEETAAAVCERIESGESLRQICEDDGMPHEATIYRWLAKEEAFCDRYARARKHWADAQIEEILAIASNTETPSDQKRVQIDTIKWAMGKLNGKYSDKMKHVGGDKDDAPIKTETQATLDVSGLNDEQLRAIASIRVPTK